MKFYSSCTPFLKIVVHKYAYCQKRWQEQGMISKWGIFISARRGLLKVQGRLVATLYNPFENSPVMCLCQLKMYLQIYQKVEVFWQSWNVFLNSFIMMGSAAAYFLRFTRLRFSIVTKCLQLLAITWVGTALHASLCPSFSPDSQQCTDIWLVLSVRCTPRALGGAELPWQWCGTSFSGLHEAASWTCLA